MGPKGTGSPAPADHQLPPDQPPAACATNSRPANIRDGSRDHINAIGSSIREPAAPFFRVFSQNIHGMNRNFLARDATDRINTCRRFGIDYAGLTEPNVDFFNGKVSSTVREAIYSAHSLVRFGYATTALSSGNFYKKRHCQTARFCFVVASSK